MDVPFSITEAFWERNFNRDLVCKNDDEKASGGRHLWIEIVLEADDTGAHAPRGDAASFRAPSVLQEEHRIRGVSMRS